MDSQDKIKVAVRVRPFNKREVSIGADQSIVQMIGNQTILHHPDGEGINKSPKAFTFDHCFNSLDCKSQDFANQSHVFSSVGESILDNAFKGYNACIFAYGQTGSGKSYSMMGSEDQQGIIPRLCVSLFDRLSRENNESDADAKVEVSYMEIYNEKVFDLLDLSSNKSGLKVREHHLTGPYVDGLSKLAVTSYKEINELMNEGNKYRTVAATNMNNQSSRSHAVFTVTITFSLQDTLTGVVGETVSRLSLVDLAGSERANKTGAVGNRLKEGSNINKSLTTLGLVISKLAEQSSGKVKGEKFIPYRDSTLTWLLKDNLGGNAKTVMMATISPAADNYEETLSTLRYADRAKKIVNHAVINEDPNAKIIRELRAEVESLKAMLQQAAHPDHVKEQLNENERLMEQYSLTWDEKLQRTGQMQEDRRTALEKMGISVESSGIKVDKERYFLVNLNADPCLNELLVYYIHGDCLIGKGDNTVNPDIILSGLGIQAQHCKIELSNNNIFIQPYDGARTCVNGKEITSRCKLKNGDRLLWGSNHFFRINCPSRDDGPIEESPFDWRMAQEEVVMSEKESDNTMKEFIAKLEKQFEQDKKDALEIQKRGLERQFNQMRTSMISSVSSTSGSVPSLNPKLQSKDINKYRRLQSEESSRQNFIELKESIIKANILVSEANLLSEELCCRARYSLTLQVPTDFLTPNKRQGMLTAEPTIICKYPRKPNKMLTLEMFENSLVEMREKYQTKSDDTEADNHEEDDFSNDYELIGVANIFLEVLFYDVKLTYAAPIISKHGKIVGKLHFDIEKTAGSFPQDRDADAESEVPDCDQVGDKNTSIQYRLRIHEASGLSSVFSNNVYCSYTPWDQAHPVSVKCVYTGLSLENINKDLVTSSVIFNHSQDITTEISEDFMEHCMFGAVSIEVYGMRSVTDTDTKSFDNAIAVKWRELSKKLSLTVSIQELNENGEYNNVKIVDENDGCGGTFQLRQGQQRRVVAMVKPISRSGGLPFSCENIVSCEVGSILVRRKDQRPLDSYQEIDLEFLREKWIQALDNRKDYLNDHIKACTDNVKKNSADHDREKSLIRQWIYLAEERNAVLAPAEDSGVPGAPSSKHIGPGIEAHIPTLFLDLSPDDLANNVSANSSLIGWDSLVSKEDSESFIVLPLLQIMSQETGVGCVASWDSSLHESIHLNKLTDSSERCYLVIRLVVRLTHPVNVDIVIRKRVCFNVRKRESLAEQLKMKLMGSGSYRDSAGVIYDIVSSLPRSSEQLEDEESLAVLAAQGEISLTEDGVTNIEKYSKQVAAAVDEILKFEKVRQNVAVKNCLPNKDGSVVLSPSRMQKTTSVPNMRHSVSSSLSSDSLSRLRQSQTLNEFSTEDVRRTCTPTQESKRRLPVSRTMDTLREDREMSLSQYQSIMSSGYESHNQLNSTTSSQSSIEHD